MRQKLEKLKRMSASTKDPKEKDRGKGKEKEKEKGREKEKEKAKEKVKDRKVDQSATNRSKIWRCQERKSNAKCLSSIWGAGEPLLFLNASDATLLLGYPRKRRRDSSDG